MQPNGWWAGRLDNEIGWLPSNHVVRQDPLELFLAKLGLIKLYDLFVREDIDMDSLQLLSDEDLASLGVKMGPRKQLLKALQDAELVSRIAQARDIEHGKVRDTMSLRTGETPAEPEHLTADGAADRADYRKTRATQVLSAATADTASTDDYLTAAIYLKVIVPEQECYKIMAFDGSMPVRECMRRVAERLATPLERPLVSYALFLPPGGLISAEGEEQLMLPNSKLAMYRPPNMGSVTLRLMRGQSGNGSLSPRGPGQVLRESARSAIKNMMGK